METRRCEACAEALPPHGGRGPKPRFCVSCAIERNRTRYQWNPAYRELQRQRTREYGRLHPVVRKLASAAWQARNPEKRKAVVVEYRKRNRQKYFARQTFWFAV